MSVKVSTLEKQKLKNKSANLSFVANKFNITRFYLNIFQNFQINVHNSKRYQ